MNRILLVALTALALIAPAAAHAAALPDWAIGPFTRYAGNPILEPRGTGFESLQVFNPGVVEVDGGYKMLYRATRPVQLSAIGLATSTDGVHFERSPANPVIRPDTPDETVAVEDPRLFYLDGTYYTFYTAVGSGTNLAEATSTDLVHWHKLGIVVPGTKNGAVVTDPHGRPVRIDGRYAMYVGQFEDFSIWRSPDMVHWEKQGPVNVGYGPLGIPDEVCVAITGYPRADGTIGDDVLLFTAGHLNPLGTWFYAISEALYSRDDLTRRLDGLHDPVFTPSAPYELLGMTPNTVFMNSILLNGNGEWMMHYGAADTVTALATAPAGIAAPARAAAPARLRLAIRRLRGRRLEVRLAGAPADVRSVRFAVDGRMLAPDRAAPFRRVTRLARHGGVVRLRATVVRADGSRATLRRSIAREPRSAG